MEKFLPGEVSSRHYGAGLFDTALDDLLLKGLLELSHYTANLTSKTYREQTGFFYHFLFCICHVLIGCVE